MGGGDRHPGSRVVARPGKGVGEPVQGQEGAPRGTVSSPLVSLRVRLMRQPGKGGAAGVPQRSGRPGRQRRALGGRVGVGLGTGAQSGASIGAAVAGE